MSMLNLEDMKTSEKIIAMEEIWSDLSKNVDADELTPQWHLKILDNREKRVKKNQAKFYDLESVKKDLSDLVLQ